MNPPALSADVVVTRAELLEHWQGHRRVTRRVIDAFPEDRLFTLHHRGQGHVHLRALGVEPPAFYDRS